MRWQDYLILLLLVGSYLIYLVVGKRRLKAGSRRRKQQLTRREEAVLSRLKAEGYQLGKAHLEVAVTVAVDEKCRPFNYQGAFTVKKGGKNYLVRFKRSEATPLTSAGLRHEMLLDYLLFQLDGILFYDSEKDRFQKLSFIIGSSSRSMERRMLQAALIILIAIGAVILYQLLGGS